MGRGGHGGCCALHVRARLRDSFTGGLLVLQCRDGLAADPGPLA
jgi:hypothetical protein